jgi:hypothetical protein
VRATTGAKESGGAIRARLGLLNDAELAAFLKISVATLQNRRLKGSLPPSAKIGRGHVTTVDDLRKWLERLKK